MIRTEAIELGNELAKMVIQLTDDVPNKDELNSIFGNVVKTVTECADFAQMPKEDRLKAAIHALSVAQVRVTEAKIVYSDEGTVDA